MFPTDKVILGVAPTRRDDANFPVQTCLNNKEAVLGQLSELGVTYVSLDGVTPDGLLATLEDVEQAGRFFSERSIDALFVPNTAYGSESAVSLLAKRIKKPLLLWAPPDPDGSGATGKPQLGLYTIGKCLRRIGISFSFMGSYPLASSGFERALRTFIAAANVVKEFYRAKILQIGGRPESFWNVIIDEGELLEKFGMPVYPVSLPDMFDLFHEIMRTRIDEINTIAQSLRERTVLCVGEEILTKSACAYLVFESLARETRSTAIAVQCWHAFANYLGIWPCAAGALLGEKGIPVACEGDVYGAISCVIARAATMGRTYPVFLDIDFAHPENTNAFNVHHCAMAPIGCYEEKPRIWRRGSPPGNTFGGTVAGKLPDHGDVTMLRFDGDNGDFSVLLANGKAIEGPEAAAKGTYGWYEVQSWPHLERKLATGPYTHHAVIIYERIAPVVYEALRYIRGVAADFAFEGEYREADEYLFMR